jgi:hypothetical protein
LGGEIRKQVGDIEENAIEEEKNKIKVVLRWLPLRANVLNNAF